MPRATDRLDPALVRLCVVVVIGGAAPLLDTTIVSVALDTLGRSFDADLSHDPVDDERLPAGHGDGDARRPGGRWTGSAPAGCGSGRSSRSASRSVLAGAAWSAGSLIAFRVLQGAAGGVLLPVGATLLVQAAGPQRLGSGHRGGVRARADRPDRRAAGRRAGRRLGELALVLLPQRAGVPARRRARPPPVPAVPGEPAQRLDVRGLAMLAPAVGALVYGLSRGPVVGARDRDRVARRVRRARAAQDDPLIDVRLFTRRSFTGATAMLFLLSASLFGSMVLVPLYVQQVLGAGALAAGAALVAAVRGHAGGADVRGQARRPAPGPGRRAGRGGRRGAGHAAVHPGRARRACCWAWRCSSAGSGSARRR